MSRIIYRELTHAERDEWASGYEAGLASLEGDQPPAPDSDPYGAGWRDGNIDARELASAAADRADAEIDAALALALPERVPMRDGHAAWALQRVEQGWGS